LGDEINKYPAKTKNFLLKMHTATPAGISDKSEQKAS